MVANPPPERKSSTTRLVLGGILTAAFGIPFVVMMTMAIGAAVGPPARDPHGYALLFGVFAALVCVPPLVIGIVLLVSGIRSIRVNRQISSPGQGS
jgi:hypothetical protein